MQILQVCNSYAPYIGGLELHVGNISERLARKHDVTVFTTNPSGALPAEEIINGVAVRRFNVFCPDRSYYISPDMLVEMKRSSFDIVHGHNYHALPLLFSKYIKKSMLVVTPHYSGQGRNMVSDILLRLYKPLGRSIFQHADKVIALDEYEKDLIIKDFGIDADKIVIIPNGIERKEIRPKKNTDDKKIVLCAARLQESKGIQYAIRALPLLDEHVHLAISGRGAYEKKLRSLVRLLGVESRVKFYTGLSRSELMEKYATASVFLLLSKHEVFSISVIEALASGVPCIVATTRGLKQWVDDRNCFGIPYPIDIKKLAALIDTTITRNIKVDYRGILDWDEIAERVDKVYEH
jgi:glycosyltransferase involved in cell wall biosynthesis